MAERALRVVCNSDPRGKRSKETILLQVRSEPLCDGRSWYSEKIAFQASYFELPVVLLFVCG
jgi:hypothetical protein